jgi:hypothetical protein
MFVSRWSLEELMDNKSKNEKALRRCNLVFLPIERSVAVDSLRNEFKSAVKQSVIQNLPQIVAEFQKELSKNLSLQGEQNDSF